MTTAGLDSALWAREAICREAARVSAARCGPALRAVVLTGSLARDEATFAGEAGSRRLLGDADFFLVFQDRAALPAPAAVESFEQEVDSSLLKKGLIASVGFAAVHGSYLRRLPRHILTYELRACGRVAWGDPDILSLVPDFPAAEISREDAWRLLANRIIELLEAIADEGDVDSPEARYRTIKLYLDMATSYLIFAGRYQPAYQGREQALRRMAENASAGPVAPFPLEPFSRRVSACTRFKMEGANPPAGLWEDAVRCARLLWRWELAQLAGATDQLSDRELMLRWMARQPLASRLRGWASLVRRCGWRGGARQWPRWLRLGWKASPRHWTYGAATEIFFQLPRLLRRDCDLDWRAVSLPWADGRPQPGTAVWQWLGCLAARNYHRFLEGTLA